MLIYRFYILNWTLSCFFFRAASHGLFCSLLKLLVFKVYLKLFTVLCAFCTA